VFPVRRLLSAPWLLVAAACSNAGPHLAPGTDASSPDGAYEVFPAEDAGAYDPDADLGIGCTDAMPGFRAAVAPILAGCAGGELCHGFPSPPLLYGQLVGAPAADGCDAGVLVDPGNLQRSYLLHKVTGIGMCPGSQRMPPGAMLAPESIQAIADWICAGAPDN
jgi:hypothetical protein